MRNLSLRMVTFLYRLVSARSSSTIKGFQFQISQSFPSYALSGHFQLIYGALASTKLSVIWRQHLNTIFYFLACKGLQLQWDLLDFVSWQGIWGVSREGWMVIRIPVLMVLKSKMKVSSDIRESLNLFTQNSWNTTDMKIRKIMKY